MTLSKERLRVISQNIRSTRIERKYTQEEVAEKTGLSTEYYGQIESGNKAPSLETLINIAECFTVSTDSLIYGRRRDTTIDSIIALLNGKNPETLLGIERLLYLVINEFIK